MKHCVDTSAYSRFMLGHPPLQKSMEESEVLILPAIVLGELHAGFEAGTRTADNEERLTSFLETTNVRIQDVTWDTARRYARLVNALRSAGSPIPTNDIWIAATALELGARLFAYDIHFQHIPGLIVESP
jgi:tRNA(fMet)-specific endonuclease VapC